MRHTLLASASAALLAGALITSGCGAGDAPKLLASGQALLAKNDFNGAKLQAKTVLQDLPDSGEARLLLGQALLAGGEWAAAEAELRRALALNQPKEAVLPALSKALMQMGKGALVLQLPGQEGLKSPEAEASFKTQLAWAHAQAGHRAEAQATLAQALAAKPDHPGARLLALRLTAAEQGPAAALQPLDTLLADQPQLAEAWLFKAELLSQLAGAADQAPVAPQQARAARPAARSADTGDAMEAALKQALVAQPDLVAAHQALVARLLERGDAAGAKAQLAQMHKVAPRHPETLMLQAILAEQAGELPRARELTQQLLRGAPDHVPLLVLAAQVERRMGALVQAETLLAKAMQKAPQAMLPRLQLAQVQLQGGLADKALATLKLMTDAPVAEAGRGRGAQDQAQALTLAAQAQLLKNDAAAAEALFARAAALAPSDTAVRTTLALAKLARQPQKPDAAALAELQAIAAADPGAAVDLALVRTHLRAADPASALKAVDAIEAKQPQQPLAPLLRAQVALQRGLPAEARKQYELALARIPDHLPAIAGLAQLDLAEQKPQAARARFAQLLERQPKHGAVLRAAAEVMARSGAPADEVIGLLQRAARAEPDFLPGQALLVDHLMATRAHREALEAGQAGLQALPDAPELLDRLGRVQLAMGQAQQAVASFGRLAQRQPKSPVPQLRLAQAQARAGQPAAAAEALRKAESLGPDEPEVLQALATAALQQQRYAPALALARRLQGLQPREADGYLLAGDVALQQRRWSDAAASYRQALALPRPAGAAQRLHSALVAGGQADEAERLAVDWRQRQPRDLDFVLYLGDIALAQARLAEAEGLYRQVQAQAPRHTVALNNLAYTLAMQKKSGGSSLVQQALAIEPGAPALLDTLALCQAVEGQLPQAVQTQGQAVQAAPDAPQFRLQLAKLQLQAGDKQAARAELVLLSKLGNRFARQAEVSALLKSTGT